MGRNWLHTATVLSIFIAGFPSFARELAKSPERGSGRNAIIRISLSDELAYLVTPFNNRSNRQQDVFILDSNIVEDALPVIPSARLLTISNLKLDSIARADGKVDYLHLVSVKASSDTARLTWQNVTAYFSRKGDKVIHRIARIDQACYFRAAHGWGELYGETTIFAPRLPK